jgi:beta-lactamase regulating signal transducer with metallopeptidase domain
VWVLGLVAALIVPALSLAVPKWELPVLRASWVGAVAVPPAGGGHGDLAVPPEGGSYGNLAVPPKGGNHTDGVVPAEAGSYGNLAVPPEGGSDGTNPVDGGKYGYATILFAIWAAGAALVLGRLLLGLAAVQLMTRRTREAADGPWMPVARELAQSLGLRRVRFVQSATASMPMAWGLFRGSVLMPAGADSWPAHRLRVVLLHELAHVKRRDCLTHVVAQVVTAVYWFNPLTWIAVRRLRSERERACDDLVLATGTRGADYADELLDIARVMSAQRFPAMIAGASLAMAHRSQLEGRLIAILDPSVPRRGLTRARAAAAAVLFGALMLSVASVQPWADERAVTKDVAEPATAPQAESTGRAVAHAEARTDAHTTVVQDGHARAVAHDPGEDISTTVAAHVGGVVSGVVDGVVDGVMAGVSQAIDQAAPAVASARAKGSADPRAVAALMDALKDTDKEVRETAMHALVQMRDPRMFEPLIAALKDVSADVREQAAFGLAQLRDPRAIDALTAVLRDSSADVREQAAFALSQIRDKRAVEPLISALKDESPDVREQAAFALGQIRDPRAVEPLVIALKDANASVREQAAFALGQTHDPRAIDGLTAAMKDTNVEVRRQAAFALGQIRY